MRQLALTALCLVTTVLVCAQDIYPPSPTGLALQQPYETKRVSSEDRPGNADRIQIGARETTTIATLEGPGEIAHLWFTIATRDQDHLRNLALRIYWDGNDFPSVESPVGDFFGLGHGRYYYFNNPVQAIGTNQGLNCFWPMPFAKSARVTIENQSDIPVRSFYFYIDWRKFEAMPEGLAYFHAQYRQAFPNETGKPYLFVDTDGSPGHFVGVNLSIHTQMPGWWGEGDDIFTIDGETTPSLWGTGSEDYFSGAWGFGKEFFTNYFGMPLRTRLDQSGNNLWNVYRYHLESPIPFQNSFRFEMEHGWDGVSNFRWLNNNYSSVAYWYQAAPTKLKGSLPPSDKRLSKLAGRPGVTFRYWDPQYMHYVRFKEGAPPVHVSMPAIKDGAGWQDDDQVEVRATESGADTLLEFETTSTQKGPLVLRMTKGPEYGELRVQLNGVPVAQKLNLYAEETTPQSIALEPVELERGKHRLRLTVTGKDKRSRGYGWGMDYLRIGGNPLDVELTERQQEADQDSGQAAGPKPETPFTPEGLDNWRANRGSWRKEAQLITAKGDLDNRLMSKRPVPAELVWPVTIRLKQGWSAGVLVGSDMEGSRAYAVRVDNRHGKLALERVGPWPEVQELAMFPLSPTDGGVLQLKVMLRKGAIQVYWPEKSQYPIMEALDIKAFGNFLGLQVIDAEASFLADTIGPLVNRKIESYIPKAGEYQHVYNPSVGEKRPWYINDHCFAHGPDGWHLYGITHAKPADPFDELDFAHAHSSDFPGSLDTWKKKPYALETDPAWGERHLWAPHVIKRGDTWYMFFCAGSREGDSHYRIHLATSQDLNTWTRHPENPLFKDTFHARDPMVLEDEGVYYLYYTANMDRGKSHHTVNVRTSRDLISWSPVSVAFVHPAEGTGAGPTESPFVVKYGSHFYLFIGPAGDYHRTAIYRSANPLWWEPRAEVGSVRSHAAEVVRDEKGNWFVSDCGWDKDGVYLAPLIWEKAGD